jgi:hypothetical protein
MRATRSVGLGVAAFVLTLGGCGGCKKGGPSPETSPESPEPTAAPVTVAVKESLPRCRADGARVAIPGEDIVTGDAAVTRDAVLVGVVRRDGTRRIASVVRASLDLGAVTTLDVGLALGDDPPPSPRLHGATVFVASFARPRTDGGAVAGGKTRVLAISRVEGATLVSAGAIVQQADDSLAFDLAWPAGDAGAPLVAWDEDAPPRAGALLSDRGVVKVQALGAEAKARVVSPDTTDAEAPRLLARPGGFWLAWLARRAEPAEDAGEAGVSEGPGERRANSWIELVTLDAKGEPTSPVRRVSPEKGHVASFDLAAAASDAQIVVVVQDEAAQVEGAGGRIVRYVIDGQKGDKAEGDDLLDGGVGHALADLLTQGGDASRPRWLAFTDTEDHAHLVPLGQGLTLAGTATSEPSLEGARIVAFASPDWLYAVAASGAADASSGRGELRRLVCR